MTTPVNLGRGDDTTRRLQPLVAGWTAGHYTLPDAVTDLLRAANRLATLTDPPAPDTQAARHEAIEATISRAAAGDLDAVDVEPLLDAQRAAERVALHAGLRQDAHRAALHRIGQTVAGQAERILVEHLRPAFAEVVATADCAADAPQGDALLDAPAQVRKAWQAMAPAMERLRAVHEARAALAKVGYAPTRDRDGLFAEVADIARVWPEFADAAVSGIVFDRDRGMSPVEHHATPPWPTDDARRRLAWLARNATLWLPTPAEQDAAYDAWAPPTEEAEADDGYPSEREVRRLRDKAAATAGARR